MSRDLIIISPTPTHPANAGNRIRIRVLLDEFDRLGVSWHFVFVRMEEADEQAMIAQWGAERCVCVDGDKMPSKRFFAQKVEDKVRKLFGLPKKWRPYPIDAWCGDGLMRKISNIHDTISPKAVWIEYVFLSRLFGMFHADCTKFLDTHDVFGNRHRMMLRQGKQPAWFYTTPRQEKLGCRRADHVIAIQDKEADYFRSMGVAVSCIGHKVAQHPPNAPSFPSPVVVFIGSSNAVNLDALEWLLMEIWPLVHKRVPQATLEVYGDCCLPFANQTHPNVRLMGRCEDVKDAYDRAWLVVAPLRMGTGLKIKSIEALGHSKALVVTGMSAEGMEAGVGNAFLLADETAEFAARCADVLENPNLRNSLELSAYQFAQNYNAGITDELATLMRLCGLMDSNGNRRA